MTEKEKKINELVSEEIEKIAEDLTEKLFKADRLIISDTTLSKDKINAHIKNTYSFLLKQLLPQILKATDEEIVNVNIDNVKNVLFSELAKKHVKKESKPKKVLTEEQKQEQKQKREQRKLKKQQEPKEQSNIKMRSVKKSNALSFKLILENK